MQQILHCNQYFQESAFIASPERTRQEFNQIMILINFYLTLMFTLNQNALSTFILIEPIQMLSKSFRNTQKYGEISYLCYCILFQVASSNIIENIKYKISKFYHFIIMNNSYEPLSSFQFPATLAGSYNNSYEYKQKQKTYNQMMDPLNSLRRSRITQNNRYVPNQPLYDPLRNAINNYRPMQNNRIQNTYAGQASSLVNHYYRPVSMQQMQNIKQNTYMIQKPLVPTLRLQNVQNKNFFVLASNQKKGTPINQFEFKSHLAASREKNILIYEPQQSPQKIAMVPQQFQQHNVSSDRHEYKPLGPVPPLSSKNKTAKYNLYSCLDEPFQRIKLFGCKNLSCPANQCVAKPPQYDWFN